MPQSLTPRFAMRGADTENRQPWYSFKNKTDGGEKVAVVRIYDEIGGWFGVTASDFVRDLEKANTDDVDKFEVHINSPGGDVFDGVAIHSALKQLDKPVKVIVDSLAASAASFIAQAGDEVVMMRNATMMIHDASGMAWGNSQYMRKQADLLDRVSNNIADIYAQSGGGSVEEWRALMQEEVWYNGTEAVEAGLATAVHDAIDEEAEEKASNWNLSVFNFAGREAAPAPSRVVQQVRVLNKAKENGMAKTVKAHDTGEAHTGEPAGATGGGETVPAGEELVTSPDVEETPDEGTGAGANTGENGAPAAAPNQPATQNRTGMVVVNVKGAQYSLPAAVAQHINVLETSQRESVEAGKKAFIKSLVDDDKATAAQIESLEGYALGLTDAGYDAWKATWEHAPKLGLTAYRHGTTTGTTSNTGSAGAQANGPSEMETLQEIVDSLARTLTPAQLARTESYIKLQALKSTTQV